MQCTRSQCGPRTASFTITQTHVRNARSRAPPTLTESGPLEVGPGNLTSQALQWMLSHVHSSEDHHARMSGCIQEARKLFRVGLNALGIRSNKVIFSLEVLGRKWFLNKVRTPPIPADSTGNLTMQLGSRLLGSRYSYLEANRAPSHFNSIWKSLSATRAFSPQQGSLTFPLMDFFFMHSCVRLHPGGLWHIATVHAALLSHSSFLCVFECGYTSPSWYVHKWLDT